MKFGFFMPFYNQNFIHLLFEANKRMFFWIIIAIISLYLVIAISAAIEVLLDNHQPSETIAWILIIMFLPIVGLLLYYFFGQDIRRERAFTKKYLDQLTHKLMAKYVAQEGSVEASRLDLSLISFLENHNFSLPFTQNAVSTYLSGDDFISRLIHDIGHARHHIHLEFFIFENDSVGRLVRDALIDAVRRNVEVRLIYDDVGCWGVSKHFFNFMRQSGIHTANFMPVRFHRFAHRINYRNHRKLVIIDGNIGYIGGMNIAKRYVRPVKGRLWYDTQLRIFGRGVYGMQLLFLMDWLSATKEVISDPVYYPTIEPRPTGGQDILLQIVSSTPFMSWPTIMLSYNKIIHNARKYILIQTPYFMPTPSLIESLQMAAMSGVKVEIMIPEDAGNFWMTWCNRSYFGDMLKAGVDIYLYTKGMLHSKTLIVDDHFCSIGSANLDFRSMLDTFEDSAFIYDDRYAQEYKSHFVAAKGECKKIDFQEWKTRTIWTRITESFVRVLSPLF